MTRREVVRTLHYLLALAHLHQARVRELRASELDLMECLSAWHEAAGTRTAP